MKGECSICGGKVRNGQRYCLLHHRAYMAAYRAGVKEITAKLRLSFKKAKKDNP